MIINTPAAIASMARILPLPEKLTPGASTMTPVAINQIAKSSVPNLPGSFIRHPFRNAAVISTVSENTRAPDPEATTYMEFNIRQASPSDAPAIVTLVNRAFEVERFFNEGNRTNLDDINRHLDNGMFLLLVQGAELAACVYLQISGDRGYIGLLSVDPSRQRMGLGSILMRHAEEYCQRAGCRAVDLRIIHLRTELLTFYRKHGYIERGTESAEVVKDAKLPVHFVVMSKDLAETAG